MEYVWTSSLWIGVFQRTTQGARVPYTEQEQLQCQLLRTSYTIEVGSKLTTLFVYFFNSQNQRAKAGSMAFRSRNFHAIYLGAGNGVSSGTHEIGIFTRSEIKGWPDVKFCAHAQCVLPRCSSRYFITWLPIHTRLSLVPTLSRLGQTCSLP